VIYTVLIVPISIARFASYAGAQVPLAFTFLADLIFALGGTVVSHRGVLYFTPAPQPDGRRLSFIIH
jgi:hypothetical protein